MDNVTIIVEPIVNEVLVSVSGGAIKGDTGEQGIQGIQGEKGDAPTTEELNALIDIAIVPYVTSMNDAIDIINGQII